jgi:hypothetical protein
MLSNRDRVTFILCLIVVFLIFSYLEILAERRQKHILMQFNFAKVYFKRHVSAAYVIAIFTVVW